MISALTAAAPFLTDMIGGSSAAKDLEQSSAAAVWNDRSFTNIAPIGVNLGAILQPHEQGSPENGGSGIELLSRFAPVSRIMEPLSGKSENLISKLGFPLILAGGGILAYYLLKRI